MILINNKFFELSITVKYLKERLSSFVRKLTSCYIKLFKKVFSPQRHCDLSDTFVAYMVVTKVELSKLGFDHCLLNLLIHTGVGDLIHLTLQTMKSSIDTLVFMDKGITDLLHTLIA